MKTKPVTFGSRLTHHREAAALTKAQLAERVGISRQYVYALEGDSKTPSWEIVCRLADVLGVTPNEFRE